MGLKDMIRGEFVDIIDWLDNTNTTLAWRFPRYDNEIKNGAQLIVREGQRAIFVYRGQLADQYDPGQLRPPQGLVPQYMRQHRDHRVARRNRREGDRDRDFLNSQDVAKSSHDIDCEPDHRKRI